MTMTVTTATDARRRFPDLRHLLRRQLALAADRRRIRREMRALSRLPVHLLRDMGLEDHAGPRAKDRWNQ